MLHRNWAGDGERGKKPMKRLLIVSLSGSVGLLFWGFIGSGWSGGKEARGAQPYRFWLAAQHSWGGKQRFYLNFENETQGDEPCHLANLRLILGVADGKNWRYLVASPRWEWNRDYAIRAVISPQAAELWLECQPVGRSTGGFQPFTSDLLANHIPGWANAPTEFLILQTFLFLHTSQGRREALSWKEGAQRPLPLWLFEPSLSQRIKWSLAPQETLTTKATFRLVRSPDLRKAAPFVDPYGQCRYADWPDKIRSDEDLKRADAEEQRRLQVWGEPVECDQLRGYQQAGWREEATGFLSVGEARRLLVAHHTREEFLFFSWECAQRRV
jgi:hypothetical protein